MEIKVLGTGCKSCKTLLERVKESVDLLGIHANIIYVTDLVEIASTGLMRTPGLMIDGKIIVSGSVPNTNEIMRVLNSLRNK